MISMKSKLFSATLYVKVHKNKFFVRHIESDNEITLSAAEPFTTTRLLVGQFRNAEKLLKEALRKVYKTNWASRSPVVVIHPTSMIEGGLSDVEERVLRELAAAVGARAVFVWVGKELSNEDVMQLVRRTTGD